MLKFFNFYIKVNIIILYSMSDSNITHNDKLEQCRKYNEELWKCIEKNNNTIKYCGKSFYYLYKCFNSVKD